MCCVPQRPLPFSVRVHHANCDCQGSNKAHSKPESMPKTAYACHTSDPARPYSKSAPSSLHNSQRHPCQGKQEGERHVQVSSRSEGAQQ